MIASSRFFLSLSLALCSPVARAGEPAVAPDLVILHANVHTLDTARPTVEAIAIAHGRIVAVGKSDEIAPLAGPQTRTIDAGGMLVLPGFDDAHVHFLEGGFQLSNVDLRDAATPEEFAERIRRFVEKSPRGKWITGGDWDHERWPTAALPTKELVDAFTPDTPLFVDRLDGHMALANSCALKLAGITRETKDPDGGLIVRDPKTHEPTGIVKDVAKSLVAHLIPEASFEAKLAAARAASEHAARFGVTSVQDMSAGSDVGVYQELLRRGELKTRIYAFAPLPNWERLAATGVHAPFGDEWIRIGGLKGFADGSLGSTTALLFDPYIDAPDTRGLPNGQMFAEGLPLGGAMAERVLRADAAGLQIAIHAIGDRANDMILSIFERVVREHGARDRRARVEHAQHLRPADIARFGTAHVIASMQPYHCADDGRWAEKRIGAERAQTTYAFRTLLDTGAVLAFGTDWTVAPIDPMLGIKAAATRQTLDGKHVDGWVPAQKISVEEAVRAYTLGSAYAEFQESEKGSITPGKLADLVILSRDIFAIDPKSIDQTHVVTTIVGGRVAYQARER